MPGSDDAITKIEHRPQIMGASSDPSDLVSRRVTSPALVTDSTARALARGLVRNLRSAHDPDRLAHLADELAVLHGGIPDSQASPPGPGSREALYVSGADLPTGNIGCSALARGIYEDLLDRGIVSSSGPRDLFAAFLESFLATCKGEGARDTATMRIVVGGGMAPTKRLEDRSAEDLLLRRYPTYPGAKANWDYILNPKECVEGGTGLLMNRSPIELMVDYINCASHHPLDPPRTLHSIPRREARILIAIRVFSDNFMDFPPILDQPSLKPIFATRTNVIRALAQDYPSVDKLEAALVEADPDYLNVLADGSCAGRGGIIGELFRALADFQQLDDEGLSLAASMRMAAWGIETFENCFNLINNIKRISLKNAAN